MLLALAPDGRRVHPLHRRRGARGRVRGGVPARERGAGDVRALRTLRGVALHRGSHAARRTDRVGLGRGPPRRVPTEPGVPQLHRCGRPLRRGHRGDAPLRGHALQRALTPWGGHRAKAEFEIRVDATLQMTCELARALIGAHQAAMSLIVGGDWLHARKYFSYSDRFAAFRDFTMPARGVGLHALVVAENRALRLTQDEVERHPAWRGYAE